MTCQRISLGLVSIGCCFFLSVTRRGLLFVLHTECLGGHGFSLSRICEFSNCFFTRIVAEVTDFLVPIFFLVPNLRICEFFLHTENRGIIFFITNYRIIEYLSHGESRRSRIFFIPRLVLGPTDRREVIAEFLSITRSVADGCGACSSCEWGTIRRCL